MIKIKIWQNKWDNWYGYVSGRKVIAFTNTPTETQRQQAERWLSERKAGGKPWPTELGVVTEERRRLHDALRNL